MDINMFLLCALICLILLGINVRRRNISNDKCVDSSKSYLGFNDLPAVKARIPIKLLGNLIDLFPLENAAKTALNWSKENGDIFTIIGAGQRFILLNFGPTVEALCKSQNFGHLAKAPLVYDRMKPYVTNGVLVSNGVFWQKQRKLMTKSRSFTSLRSHTPMIERYNKLLIEDLDELFKDGKSHEIRYPISTTFVGITSEIITGKERHDPNELKDYHDHFTIWKEVVFRRIINPFLQLKPIWMFHPLYKANENAVKGMSDFGRRRLEEYKISIKSAPNSETTHKTMLDDLMDAGVEEKQILDEINTFMFGGHETAAVAIEFFCLCVALNPEIQLETRKENDEFFQESNNLEDGMMTYELIQGNLKYLERCLLETLRMFPPSFAITRRLESPLMTEYKGKPVQIPKGVNIVLCPFILHRREEIYPNPEKFDPDRFTPEEIAKRHPYSFIPFSAPRNCLGQKLAMIELKIIAAYILRQFELSTTEKMEDVELLPYLTISPKKHFTFLFKRRHLYK